ncbi:MAG: sulfatase-like hydrolase/transferase, partial [Opitutales bacterium]
MHRFFFLILFSSLAIPAFALDAKPNVLFIAIDDQNDWIGYLGGHPMVKTPHIDRLAARGTAFTNAHCQSPLCNSSRTSLMTGLRPSTTGVYGLAPWFRTLPELKNHVTLPQYLKKHGGYTTYSTGKIYHGG